MEKRSTYEWNSKRVEEEEPVIEEAPKTVRLVLNKNLLLKIRGPITGTLYVFNGGGSSLEVDERDAVEMLQKGIRKSCCGGAAPSPYFTVLGGNQWV